MTAASVLIRFLCSGFLLASQMSYGAIFGDGNQINGPEDDRTAAPKHLLGGVGTVFCDGALRGTAAQIQIDAMSFKHAPTIIVTAAHVLFDANSGKPFADCRYRPQNKRLRSVPFDKISTHSYQPVDGDKLRQSETDIVFVALQHRVYDTGFKLSSSATTDELLLLGYNDSTDNIDLSGSCRQYQSQKFNHVGLLLHDCDSTAGASGGPLLAAAHGDIRNKKKYQVIAVHGGTLASIDQAAPGARAHAEQWINQARKIDSIILGRLKRFLAYLQKGSVN
jgi:V8-like Glu-specific endopeptidase